MKRQLTRELEDDFFFVHESIVHGVLKRCSIWFDHPNYDDYLQIGLLKLVEAYEIFPKDLFNETYFYQFTGFAFQKIRWAIVDELCKKSRKAGFKTGLPEDLDSFQTLTFSDNEDWIVWELFPSMLNCLSKSEQSYLKDAVLEQLSVTDIARKHSVSRKTVYGWKKKVGHKLEHFKTALKY